jgi:hypothetical protein
MKNLDLIILAVVLVAVLGGGVYVASIMPTQQQIYNTLTK